MANICIKRVYEAPDGGDGYRVLVDRLWPRGVSKDKARLDEWLKDVGPSDELRKWFGHDPAKYDEFKTRYERELATNPAFTQLQEMAAEHPMLTLVYSAHDEAHNQAVVLQAALKK